MFMLTLTFLRRHLRTILLCVVACLVGIGLHRLLTSPETIVVEEPVPHVRTIEVPKITPDIINTYIPVVDQRQVNDLRAENARLHVRLDEISVSHGTAESSGTGTATTELVPSSTPATRERAVHFIFQDYRLHLDSLDNKVTYTLTQHFAIVNSVGRTSRGTPTNLIRLYEIGPGETRTLIPTTDTTTLAITPTPHWYIYPTVQAGLGTTIGTGHTTGGVVAAQWLKRGRTQLPQDTRWAIASPAILFGGTTSRLGVLPASFNIGSLSRQPFTNVWVSPFVGVTTARTLQYGVVASVTF